MRGLSLVVASGGHSSSWWAGLSLSRPLLLRSTGSRRAGSVIVALGPSCSAACGILPDQGSNPRPLHWQADSQPPRHQGSPNLTFKKMLGDFPGDAVFKNPPANAGDTGSGPGPGRSHVPQSNEAHAPQLMKPACLEPMQRNKRSNSNEKPVHRNKE